MEMFELFENHCKFIPGKGMVLKKQAPQEAVKAYQKWKESKSVKPDENGVIIRIID